MSLLHSNLIIPTAATFRRAGVLSMRGFFQTVKNTSLHASHDGRDLRQEGRVCMTIATEVLSSVVIGRVVSTCSSPCFTGNPPQPITEC